jgi:hypothetical protein
MTELRMTRFLLFAYAFAAAFSGAGAFAEEADKLWPGQEVFRNVYDGLCLPDKEKVSVRFDGTGFCREEEGKFRCSNASSGGDPAALFGAYIGCRMTDNLHASIQSFIPCKELETTTDARLKDSPAYRAAVTHCGQTVQTGGYFGFER